MDIEILVGLPGCGKTTYASSKTSVLDCDRFKRNFINEILDSMIYRQRSRVKNITLDGMFIDHDVLYELLERIYKEFPKAFVDLVVWEPNIDYCLYNDKYRRNINSTGTIKYGTYNVNLDLLKSKYPIEVTKKLTFKKPQWKLFAHKYFNTEDSIYRSDSWSLGGTYGNCWNNHKSTVSPEDPKEPHFFDNILERICPEIGFLKYKKIKEKVLELDNYGESDYYGGYVNYAQWKVNIKEFYEVLQEYSLLENDEDFL